MRIVLLILALAVVSSAAPVHAVTLRWAAEHSFVIGSNGATPAGAPVIDRNEREGQPT